MSLALPSCRNTLVRVSLWLDLRNRRLTRSLARPRIRGVHSFCVESGCHRSDQRTASVRYQADTQSDRARGVKQIALALVP